MNSPHQIWNRSGLLFGKMWEDSNIEMSLAEQVVSRQGECRALSIASSGDTSFALASIDGVTVEATDINPTQVWLCQLKQTILQELGTDALVERLYKDARPTFERLKLALPDDCREFWEGNTFLLKDGFHRAGRIDRMMSFWVWLFSRIVVSRPNIDQLLCCDELVLQTEMIERQWRGWKWDLGIKVAFWRPILRAIYGRELIKRLPQDFSQQMSDRMQHFLTSFQARTNPYLWQTFASAELGTARAPYQGAWGPVSFFPGTVEERVDKREDNYDLFVLSNILEVAESEQREELLRAVRASANPGAVVCLRFMAPRPPIWPQLEYLEKESTEAGGRDRAFFCNHFQIFRL